MITDPSWEQVFEAFWTRRIAGVHTAMPGIVRAYDEATALAEVQPAIRWDGRDLPPLKDVRVAHPAGGGYSVTFPLTAGDEVELVFEEVDPGNHLDGGGVEDPRTLRRHGFTAIALPVRRPSGTAPAHEAGKLVIASPGARFVLDGTSAYVGGSVGAVALALAPTVDARLTALENFANTHIHSGVTTGAGSSAVAVTPVTPGASVAATKAKGI